MIGEQVCLVCGRGLPVDSFYGHNETGSKMRECKDCWKARGLRNRATPNGRRLSRIRYVRQTYGIDWEGVLLESWGRCDCCGDAFANRPEEPGIEHCHATGKIRGLCCSRCNHAIGHCLDSPERALMVADYLIRHAPPGSFLMQATNDTNPATKEAPPSAHHRVRTEGRNKSQGRDHDSVPGVVGIC